MTNFLQKFAINTATIAVFIVPFNATSAIALNLGFHGKIESGDLTGASYNGSFDIPDLGANFTGTLNINSLSIKLNLNNFNSTFTENDAIFKPLAEFFNGDLLGIDYGVNNAELGSVQFNFQLTPGFFDVSEAAVFYDVINGGIGGTGNVQFTTGSKEVPEPITILGSGIALGFGGLFKRQKKQNNKKS